MFSFLENIFSIFKKKVIYINSEVEWYSLIKSLKKEKIIGIDTEFDWRTTYFPKLCLIQISTKKEIYLIDSLAINNFEELKKIFEDKSILKIFHAVRSDSTVLSKCLNINLQNVFDVQQAEKFLTEGEIFSYSHIVKKYFEIFLEKSETNSNWLKRPLSENQIKYAADDVDYLIKIFDFQRKILTKKEFKKVTRISELESSYGKEDLVKSRLKKRLKKFTDKETKIFIWREQTAAYEDVPPNYIFKEKDISYLAKFSVNKSKKLKKNLLKILGNSKYVDEFISEFQ